MSNITVILAFNVSGTATFYRVTETQIDEIVIKSNNKHGIIDSTEELDEDQCGVLYYDDTAGMATPDRCVPYH